MLVLVLVLLFPYHECLLLLLSDPPLLSLNTVHLFSHESVSQKEKQSIPTIYGVRAILVDYI